MKKPRLLLALLVVSLVGCGQASHQNSRAIAERLEDGLECQDFEPHFWHTLHDASLNSKTPTSWESLKTAFREREILAKNKNSLKLIDTLERHLGDSFWEKTPQHQVMVWAQLELKLEENEGWPELQTELAKLFQSQTEGKTKSCDKGANPPQPPSTPDQPQNPEVPLEPEPSKPPIDEPKVTGPSQWGGRWVMATAYQSCEAVEMPPMNSQTQDALGIAITGRHPAGGNIREIENLSLVQKTHPYLRIQNKEAGCFNVEAKPLIYDFGGKPAYASSGSRELDLFKNAGSGSQELGIDCSGLVFASFGVQGLRLIPHQDMTAGTVSGFGSSSLLSPPSAWKCVDRISIGQQDSLKPGDVISVQGHTILVDQVGEDPWGLRFAANRDQCSTITEAHFDFVVLQSSPSKNGVGINRYIARDYLQESSKMRTGLIKYAQNHCRARFDQSPSKPKWSDISIIRHKGTSECLGRPLTLKAESCVQSCMGATRPTSLNLLLTQQVLREP